MAAKLWFFNESREIAVNQKVRYRIDGGNPTKKEGHILMPGERLVLSESALKNFKVVSIRKNTKKL
jgi:hypothetical protein